MTTQYFKKDFVSTPSLEAATLLFCYNRYMKMLADGAQQMQARAAAGLDNLVKFQKAKKAFRAACS